MSCDAQVGLAASHHLSIQQPENAHGTRMFACLSFFLCSFPVVELAAREPDCSLLAASAMAQAAFLVAASSPACYAPVRVLCASTLWCRVMYLEGNRVACSWRAGAEAP